MADPAKIPDKFVSLTPGRMEIGEQQTYSHSCLVVDIEGNGYIDPFAKPVGTHSAGEQLLLLERVEGGFKVDLTKWNYPWLPQAKPEPKHGIAWIPVVEVVAGPS